MELVQRCLQGDQRAQYELYSKYSQAMFNVCLRMMRSREEAEDALQNAFVDIFRKLDSFRAEATLGAWIKRIVVNHCINSLKKKKLLTADLMDHHGPHVEPHYECRFDTQQEVTRIKNAIQQLPEGYRVVFSLYALEGYDHKEIAEIMQISEGGSKSQYSRARHKLKSILTNEESAA
ncbi:MAG: RNA polymerase sigma factor [Saprospiraceae bacterium]|nr:RNA polymerase sigma factor [Saprospiraceae bacterium]